MQKSIKWQNALVVVASYVFYGWWDWRFLSLVLFSTLVDYLIGRKLAIEDEEAKRKLYLWLSIVVNLGFLGFFKYYNFFIENFESAFSFFGRDIAISSLHVILPVGISFYTFQTLSYTIDVYRKKLEPTNDFVAFAAFVSFFPQLVAGPIERATHLLPQFYKQRKFEYAKAVDGMRQILWGLFKKIVIADNCAEIANEIFNNSGAYNGSALVIGAIFFAFQIYGDFSGYSDIAIGTSRFFGFDLMKNFAFPYFSRDIAEFWRRWHISLSTWFRDYVYIPLGGSRGSLASKVRNTFIIFIVSGFWHGANWTFIAWGTLNAIYFLPLLLLQRNRNNTDNVAQGNFLPSIKELVAMLSTFGITVLAWVFFRADSISHACSYIGGIYSRSIFSVPNLNDLRSTVIVFGLLGLFVFMEWLGREREFALAYVTGFKNRSVRWVLYIAVLVLIVVFSGAEQDFIYFQF